MKCEKYGEQCPDPEWCMQGGDCEAARLDAGLPVQWLNPPPVIRPWWTTIFRRRS